MDLILLKSLIVHKISCNRLLVCWLFLLFWPLFSWNNCCIHPKYALINTSTGYGRDWNQQCLIQKASPWICVWSIYTLLPGQVSAGFIFESQFVNQHDDTLWEIHFNNIVWWSTSQMCMAHYHMVVLHMMQFYCKILFGSSDCLMYRLFASLHNIYNMLWLKS